MRRSPAFRAKAIASNRTPLLFMQGMLDPLVPVELNCDTSLAIGDFISFYSGTSLPSGCDAGASRSWSNDVVPHPVGFWTQRRYFGAYAGASHHFGVNPEAGMTGGSAMAQDALRFLAQKSPP